MCKTDFIGQCTQKNVVYSLRCKICDGMGVKTEYVGESKRPIRLRYNEHLRDMVRRKEDTPMGDHVRTAHPEADCSSSSVEVRILYRAMDHPDRKIAESLMIRDRRPCLNSNVTSWPIM